MSFAVSSLPAVPPGGATVHVTIMPLFDPDARRIKFAVPQGSTIADILAVARAYVPESVHGRVRVALVTSSGLRVVDRPRWSIERPGAGEHVVIHIAPGGGALLPVLNLLTTVAAKAIAGSVGLGPLGTNLLAFAITTAGGLLLNMLFARRQEDQQREKPSYVISGWKNELQPDAPVPMVLGSPRYAPRYAAYTWTEVVGDDIYIRSSFLWGYPVALSDVKIGETPIDDFDMEVESVTAVLSPANMRLYPKQVIEESIGADLVKDRDLDDYGQPTGAPVERPITRRTAADASEACIILHFEAGLFETDDKGNRSSEIVDIEVAYRLVGDAGAFSVVTTLHFDEEIKRPFFRDFRLPFPARGRYEVRLTRKTANEEDIEDVDRVKWFALQTFRPEFPFNFGKAITVTNVRIKATGQLNGTLDTFNGLPFGLVRDLVDGSWIGGQQTKNCAALALHAITGPHRVTPSPDDEIDWPKFAEWHADCAPGGLTAGGLHYNRVHDFEGEGLGDVLAAIGAVGRAAVWHDGEKWTVSLIDKPQSVIVDHINPRNAANFGWRATYLERQPDEFRIQFLDETDDFREAERRVPWPPDVTYNTLAELAADLDWSEGRTGEVVADPTPANNRQYRKAGPKGSGSWIVKVFAVSQSITIPGITNPALAWLAVRRLQYERIYRNVMFTATQQGSARVVTLGDCVMLSRDVTITRAMNAARVTSVHGKRAALDDTFEMEAGKDYAIRFRRFADPADTLGTSVVRTIKTVAGAQKAVTLTGDGEGPVVGDLLHFGLSGQDSIKVIVAGIERDEDGNNTLHMLPAADEMHARLAAEVPPAWNGRTGAEAEADATVPPVPIVLAVRHGLTGTGDADGLMVRLRPGEASAVVVTGFEIQHRLSGSGVWLGPIYTPAGSAVIEIPGYTNGVAVEWQPREISIDGVPSAWGTSRTTTIGSGDPVAPGALNTDLIIVQAGLGRADIYFTIPEATANTTHVQLYTNDTGTLDPDNDRVLDPIAVQPGGTYSRVIGDPARVTLITNGDLAAASPPPATGIGWSVAAGKASHAAGSSGLLSWDGLTLTPGADYRYALTVDSISGVGAGLTPQLSGGTPVTGTVLDAPGRALGILTAVTDNETFEVEATASTSADIDDLALYKATADCLPQGDNYVWLRPFNGLVPGPATVPFLISVP